MSEIYTVFTVPTAINFMPATVAEEILQNVYTIVTTHEFSVPLFRAFGVSGTYIDSTDMIARMKLTAEIMEKVELYEPRVIVEEVDYQSNGENGELYPIIKLRIKEGVA